MIIETMHSNIRSSSQELNEINSDYAALKETNHSLEMELRLLQEKMSAEQDCIFENVAILLDSKKRKIEELMNTKLSEVGHENIAEKREKEKTSHTQNTLKIVHEYNQETVHSSGDTFLPSPVSPGERCEEDRIPPTPCETVNKAVKRTKNMFDSESD